MGRKVRVNISVDAEMLKKAKSKLNLFGGKLSTLFNAYLSDFVDSIETPRNEPESVRNKMKELEARIKKLESSKR